MYEIPFQGKRYEDYAVAMLLNYGYTLGYTRTEEDEIDQVI